MSKKGQEINKYEITFKYSMRIGQTVFIIKANRESRCPQCRHTSSWKHYVKKTKITALSFFVGINGKQEIYYYYQEGRDKWSHFNDEIIYLTLKDAQEACDIENTKPQGKR